MNEINQKSQAQQPVNPTSPVVNSSNSKLITIIIGVFAVAIIGIGAYLLGTKQSEAPVLYPAQTTPIPSPVPTIDETANWKTYTNTKVGFQIKYPQRYPAPTIIGILKEADGSEDNKDILFGTKAKDIVSLKDYFTIGIRINSGTIDDLLNKINLQIENEDKTDTTKSQANEFMLNGKRTIWVTRTTQIDSEILTENSIYVIGNNRIINIYTTSDNATEFNQILSTFKFTP